MKVVATIAKTIFILVGSVVALIVLGAVFWIKIQPWLSAQFFLGADTPQYIYYVTYYLKHPHFPVNAWDYFWHNGVPRVLDLTWLHFTLNALLAGKIGLYESIKFYPLIYMAILIIFSYLLFLDLSGSVLLALGLSISLTIGEAIYLDLFSAGVVLSSISHAFLPITLFFLVRFYKSQKRKYLILGGVSTALGFYTHGLIGMFWVFIPCFVFLLFASKSWGRMIDGESILNALIFAVMAFTVGALATWPHLLQALEGGSNRTVFEKVQTMKYGTVFTEMGKFNDPGIIYAFILAIFVAFLFLIFGRKKPDRLLGALVAVMVFYLLWLLSYKIGINPLVGVIFPGRIYWIWTIFLGSITAILLAPLSQVSTRKITGFVAKLIGFNFVKIVIFGASILGLSVYSLNIEYFKNLLIGKREFKNINISTYHYEINKNFLALVDPDDKNVRLWTHIAPINLTWKTHSDIPLSEGYAHVWTKYSRAWEGWLFAVLSQPNWETQEIPREVVSQQAKFFIDWYGLKYLIGITDVGENAISPYFYGDGQNCIADSRRASETDSTTIFVVKENCTSGIVKSVKSPVLGFVGSNRGYEHFLRSLATLNWNTDYLIPLKVADSVAGISAEKLTSVDALVVYDFEGGRFFPSRGWTRVRDFVGKGGRVWIESGGNSYLRESNRLPNIFPVTKLKYGPLGTVWQPGGEISEKFDFSSLGKLVYRGDPWKISYTVSEAVKPGAKVLLSQDGNPVAVEQNLGQGKVLWTGINSFFLFEDKMREKTKEIALLETLFANLLGEPQKTRVEERVVRPNPENITVEGENFSGVVFKETNWPGWVAKVKSKMEDGKWKMGNAPILTAGPELMYIPIPKEMRKGEIKVYLNYRGTPIYWLSFFVSLFSAVLIVIYLFFGKLILKFVKPGERIKRHLERVVKRTAGWWETEEE